MSTIVRECPQCGKATRLPMPPPAWDGPKSCPLCGASLGVCLARKEPFFFHLFRMPADGETPHVCRAHERLAAKAA